MKNQKSGNEFEKLKWKMENGIWKIEDGELEIINMI